MQDVGACRWARSDGARGRETSGAAATRTGSKGGDSLAQAELTAELRDFRTGFSPGAAHEIYFDFR